MGLLRVIVAALTFSLATAFATADPALEDMAVRTELIPIQTYSVRFAVLDGPTPKQRPLLDYCE
jgi:hypothetical protein